MTAIERTRNSLRREGPRALVTKFCVLLADYWFDFRHGVDTCAWSQLDELTIASENKQAGFRYQPTRVLPLRKLFQLLQPMIPAGGALVDLGCGKGRVLLVAAKSGFKQVQGVEFAHELCEIARNNCATFKARTRVGAEFGIVEGDVTQYAVRPDESVFFLGNPFGETILNQVLDNIVASLQAKPRKVLIIYYNPTSARAIEQRNCFTPLREINLLGYHFRVYANRE